jgi:uncharacterized repeat protein (TIGR04052 family)
MKTLNKTTFTLASIATAVLTACGGGSHNPSPTASISGTVVDGYLSGVTVCVDINKNGKCDAGEPSATTASNGTYTISGVATADVAAAPLVAFVPSTAIDADSPSTTVGNNFVLSAPAGKTVISPLTTLVQQAMLKDSTLTADTAATALKSSVPSLATTDLFADYVATNRTSDHEAAKVVANSLKANYDRVRTNATGKDKELAITLGDVAKQALQSQGSVPNSTLPVGAEDPNTLLAQLAARTASATGATQAVSINLDLVNGGSSVRCGDAITLANTALWDHTTDTKLATPGATGGQSTAGQFVDTRFYVANVMLMDANGNATPLVLTDNTNQSAAGGLALLDFGHNTAAIGVSCSTTYYTSLTGHVAPGTYTGIAMTIGVPARSADFSTRLNHTNAADPTVPLPLTSMDMAWAWQSGRKFTKIEFQPTTPIDKIGVATAPKWNVHLGSTGCSGDPTTGNETACTNPNRLALSFASFNAASQKIVFDVAQLFKETDVSFDGGGAPGCMSGSTDPECAPIFKALGIELATGKTLNSASVQSVFSVK